jgi:hypothetical protein
MTAADFSVLRPVPERIIIGFNMSLAKRIEACVSAHNSVPFMAI